jgi:LCP family protein required for cell wall assembly
MTICLLAGTLLLSGCGKHEDEVSASAAPQEEASIYGDASLGIDAAVDEQLRDYRNIAIFGIDAGNRTDIIMVLSINEKTSEAKIVAVHRDTYMQLTDGEPYKVDGVVREFSKCNRAYLYGDKYEAMKELNRHMDLNIKECVGIDWAGITELVDGLGGIDVEVTEAMLPYVNNLIDDESQHLSAAGMQHLNGTQAIGYLRCRKDPGSDATVREARNQAVLSQLYQRAQGMSVQELAELYDQLAKKIDTNMSRTTMTDLFATVASTPLTETPAWPYEYEVLLQDDNTYDYLVPETLLSNVTELHKTLFEQENYEPTETVQMLNDRIIELKEEQLHSL